MSETRMTATEVVASNVRRLRADRSWSLDAMAKRMDEIGQPMGISAISKVENNDRGVSVDDLTAFARAFEVEVEALLVAGDEGALRDALDLVHEWRYQRSRELEHLRVLELAQSNASIGTTERERSERDLRHYLRQSSDEVSTSELIAGIRLQVGPELAAEIKTIITEEQS